MALLGKVSLVELTVCVVFQVLKAAILIKVLPVPLLIAVLIRAVAAQVSALIIKPPEAIAVPLVLLILSQEPLLVISLVGPGGSFLYTLSSVLIDGAKLAILCKIAPGHNGLIFGIDPFAL